MANDLPPPAAPPYSTSRSDEAKKSVCGPSFGLNNTSGSTSLGSGKTMGASSFCGSSFVGTTEGLFFEFLNFVKRLFEPFGELAFNCSCCLTFSVNVYSFS